MNEGPAPNASCPRCGGGFRCGVSDQAPCACTRVVLPPALLQQLRQQHQGCLCLVCLSELAADASARRD